MKNITVGVLAHVDGGKTTLSEALLYTTGKIRTLGRVDHKDAYLDTFNLERERGITIFSKQAIIEYNNIKITLLDTPGHVDFSAEMERTLQVLDYAILIVSGSEGVQGHTETLWKLLRQYNVPTFVFVNKMDMPNTDKHKLMQQMNDMLDENIVDFTDVESSYENIAVCDENVLETFMDTGKIEDELILELIGMRKIFPCYFGAALKLKGVEELLEGLDKYTFEKIYNEEFGAKVFKIARDDQNNRETYLKLTGSSLKVKDEIEYGNDLNEKVNEIRLYSGNKYETVSEVKAGDVCTVMGLSKTYSGQGLGFESESEKPQLQPVLSYNIKILDDHNINLTYQLLKEIEEEDPTLQFSWNYQSKEIIANIMGPIQIQVLKELVRQRFDIDIEFGAGTIVYRETIAEEVEGVGHFEPLRHYAEVHLLMEPLAPGSGLVFSSDMNESELGRNWQRLILTHLAEKQHKGVLTGSEITDMSITLIAGKAHLKHTEGGDFREATYRAVRQGLKKAKSILLEPYYDFILDLPSENTGRAMNDISQMSGSVNPPELLSDKTRLTGYAPVSTMRDYIMEVNEYTHGSGNLTLKLKGYAPCHNQQEIIDQIEYDSDSDLANPTGSVFCAGGAGFNVPWNQVEDYMHVTINSNRNTREVINDRATKTEYHDTYAGDKELEAIFERTFGPVKRKKYKESQTRNYTKNESKYKGKSRPILPQCVLVDGYNIIFAWEELKNIASANIDGARDRLIEILSNYQGYKGNTVIVVFDAYNVKNHKETIYKHNNIYVVYTKEAETADMYIGKTTHTMAKSYQVTVATSDALEQLIIMGHGALRMSANNFKEEIDIVNNQITEKINTTNHLNNYVIKDNPQGQ